jgi:hypothetical protein
MKHILTLSILIQLWIFTALSPAVFSSTGQGDQEKSGVVLAAAPKQASTVQSLPGETAAFGFPADLTEVQANADPDDALCVGKQIFSSSDSWPDSIAKSTMNENHPFRISKGKPGGISPNATDNETIRYDNGTNFSGIGSEGGVIYAAAYFPASTMQQYAGMALENVEIYIGQNPISIMLMIYGPGSTSSPGDTIYTQPVTATANSWNMIALASPVSVTGEDLWICYQAVHDSGSYPAGVDAGPAIAGFGDMASEDGIIWVSLAAVGLNYNWNIAGYLEEGEVQANAGPDDAICEELPYYLVGASAANYSFLQWTSNGDGYFDDETLLNPTYTPGVMDITVGLVELCITAYSNDGNVASDCMELSILALPNVFAGNDITVCDGDQVVLSQATASNYGALQWITLDGNGYFDDETALNPTYFPSALDYISGCISIAVYASPISPCTVVAVDYVNVCFQMNPNVDARADATICEGGSFTASATSQNTCGLMWTTTGNGTFDNDGSLTATYTPGIADIASGGATLCLSGAACAPCVQGAQDCLEITIQKLPGVFAGNDFTVCEGDQVLLSQATASNYDALQWITLDGSGYFDHEDILNPTYYPSAQDYIMGCVEIIVYASPISPCTVAAVDYVNVCFQMNPSVNAGADATIATGVSFINPDAIAINYSTLHWTTTGDGNFNNTANLHPTYTPGNGDKNNGSVTLCLDALPINPCQLTATDCMVLSITTLPSGLDFGDAPEMGGMLFSFPTTLANGGAAHVIDPAIFLGNKIDGEPDGQPSIGADGDDNDLLYPSSGDDEDGVILPASVFAATSVIITVKASVAGYLDAWMDFDLDHTWFDPMEHIFTNQPLAAGNNTLTFIVPAIAVPGQSYLRFRFRDYNIPLSFDGFANNGEVEDYTVLIKENTIDGWDFGDAPQGGGLYAYPTLLSADGARHHFVPGIYLGALIDVEADGQPTSNADGDDTDILYPSLGDDEDGVTLPAAVSPGAVTTIQVQASVSGFLDAWMDFDLNGNWTAPNEHIFTTQPLNPGVNTLSFTVPSTAAAGQSFLRFRFRDNAAPLSFNGPADNGEVEDYAMQIAQTPAGGWDFGDAPDGMGSNLFPTLLTNNGARHAIVPGIYLGVFVDTEPDGQPNLAATGDDMDLVYPSAGDDEDGVTFTSQLISGSTATITVTSSVDGYLDAWMDFNGDGQWTATAEHIFTSLPLAAVTNHLSFNIPASATPGTSYIRFRFRDYDNPLNYYGACENGEVEDYRVEIMDGSIPQMDFGDAPESTQPFLLSYPTTLAHNGAAHIIDPAIYLGTLVDAEPDGQPNAAANGDDIDVLYPSMGDDEDGVILPDSVSPGSTVTIVVLASVNGYLDAWMDFDRDNTWLAPNEHIFDMQALVAGSDTLTFDVPAEATAGQSYLRFRFRDYAGPLSFDGIANNGEVEDYSVQIQQPEIIGMDWGDAPDSPYPTLYSSDGARHFNHQNFMHLGNLIDNEMDGLQSLDSKGDDLNNIDDEDGVSFVNTMYAGGIANLQIVASVGGYLNAWMDFDQNGSWADAGDQIFTNQWLTAGTNTLNVTIPASASTGNTFMRFRFSSQAGLTFTGLAQDGEVEDYQVSVYPTWIIIDPTIDPHIILVPLGLQPIQAGDMLGVFFINDSAQEQCGGTMLYDGQTNQLLAFGDDELTPDVKEGFAAGEMINWKLFSAATGSVEDVEVDYDQSYPNHDGTFVPFGFSALTAINYSENPCGLPPGWEVTVTGLVHSISIPLSANPNIFGDALSMGDWIGVFHCDCCDDDCSGPDGTVQWNGTSGVVINVYGDDPFTPEIDGFAEGEPLIWKIYDCDAMEEFSAIATYNPEMPCEGNFGDLCLSELLSLEAAWVQDYSLTEGWNSISTYLVPSDPDVENIFAPNVDELIILKNLTTLYWPYAGVNTIGTWDNQSGYAIKVSEGFEMKIAGVEFANTELTLAAGWHYLPVLSACDVNVDELFSPYMDKITIISDLIGSKVWWPAMGVFTLETLEPGKAYKIRVEESVSLSFAPCDSLKSAPTESREINRSETPWGGLIRTPGSHIIAWPGAAIADLTPGDCLGAFDAAGNLYGFLEIENTSENSVMMIYGDDGTTAGKDGFADCETIYFKLLRKQSGESNPIDVHFDPSMPNAEAIFSTNGISAIEAITGLDADRHAGNIDDLKIYPNPTSGLIQIEGLPADAELTIFDALGNILIPVQNGNNSQFDLRSFPRGIYYIRVTNDAHVRYEKLILN